VTDVRSMSAANAWHRGGSTQQESGGGADQPESWAARIRREAAHGRAVPHHAIERGGGSGVGAAGRRREESPEPARIHQRSRGNDEMESGIWAQTWPKIESRVYYAQNCVPCVLRSKLRPARIYFWQPLVTHSPKILFWRWLLYQEIVLHGHASMYARYIYDRHCTLHAGYRKLRKYCFA
jgi:hypothetical protein